MVVKLPHQCFYRALVWEWCNSVWWSNHYSVECVNHKFESDVILYGGQTQVISMKAIRRFESDVILYGGQTSVQVPLNVLLFESDVILYGGQTFYICWNDCWKFESDVILYGGQTFGNYHGVI